MSKRTWYRNIAKATHSDLQDLSNELLVLQRDSILLDECESETASCSANVQQASSDKPLNHLNVGSESTVSFTNLDVECKYGSNECNDEIVECDRENVATIDVWDELPLKDDNESLCIEGEVSKVVPKVQSLSSSLAEWALNGNISHRNCTDLLKILKKYHPELPGDCRTLLGTIRTKAPVLSMGKGSFIYFGLARNFHQLLRDYKFNESELVLTFNIDGQSPFKSSKMELWPILCKVDNIPHKPFIVCSYYGRGKPESASDFMDEYLTELDFLVRNNFTYNGCSIKITVRAFICDFPAAAFVKCTLNSNGFVGCCKCFVRGISIDHSRVYHGLNERLRTDHNFRLKEQEDHHKGNSPLLKLEYIDMIKCFPVDPMHTIFINVVKKLCVVWKKGKNRYCQVQIQRGREIRDVFRKKSRRSNKMLTTSIKAVDEKIDFLIKYMPSEFERILSPFSDSDSWKANQGRQFIMYLAPVVLKGNLDRDLYDHMLLLHKACRIMSSKILCSSLVDEAERLLKSFVGQCKHLLGIDFTTPAVHALIHLPSDCMVHGTLDRFSAFPFESFQGELRTLIRGYARPLQQLWKRLSEKENQAYQIPEQVDPCEDTVSHVRPAKNDQGPTCGRSGEHFFRLKFRGLSLSLTHKDNTFILNDDSIIRAANFIKESSDWFVVGKIFKTCSDFYSESSKVFVWKVTCLSSDYFCWPLSCVVGKAVLLPEKQHYICMRLLHC